MPSWVLSTYQNSARRRRHTDGRMIHRVHSFADYKDHHFSIQSVVDTTVSITARNKFTSRPSSHAAHSIELSLDYLYAGLHIVVTRQFN